MSPVARLPSLDVLRGVGVLGMLATHIQSFAMVAAARTSPSIGGDLDGVNGWIWLATYVLADGKFLAVFAVLFGASCAMLVDRAAGAERSAALVHYRRMTVLFVVGALHASLVWYGDMLTSMALCGALVFMYRGLPPRRQVGLGLLILGLGGVIWAISLAWSPASVAPAGASATSAAWEIARYRGGWLEQMDHRLPTALALATSSLATHGLWQITGLMLIGMALFRLGILGGGRGSRFYALLAALGFGLGVPAAIYGAPGLAAASAPALLPIVAAQLKFWAGALVAFGWIGLVLLACRSGWRLAPVAAVGRLALTNYLLQSLVCTLLFYGHGLGLFARVDRRGQLAIVVGIWAVQLVGSTWWSRRFALGPMEWVLRRLTYGRPQPIMKPRFAGAVED